MRFSSAVCFGEASLVFCVSGIFKRPLATGHCQAIAPAEPTASCILESFNGGKGGGGGKTNFLSDGPRSIDPGDTSLPLPILFLSIPLTTVVMEHPKGTLGVVFRGRGWHFTSPLSPGIETIHPPPPKGHGGVDVVYSASFEAPVEALRLTATRLRAVGETYRTLLDIRRYTGVTW